MRKRKIKEGWDSIYIKKQKFQKTNVSWTTRYEFKHSNDKKVFSNIIKFIIKISLFFAFDRKNVTKSKMNLTVNNTYSILSSSKFKFIPSSIALYLLLTLVPIFIIVLSFVNFINLDWGNFLMNDVLEKLIPGIRNMFISQDLNAGQILVITFFMASSIWFASKGITKFRDSFVELYGFEDRQNFIIKRIRAIFIVIAISTFFTTTALAFIPVAMQINNLLINNALKEILFYTVSSLYIIFFGYFGIGLLFKYISPIKLKWSYLNLGILVSLIPTAIFLLLFSTICRLLKYEKFGTIGAFLYLVIFILYISYFLHAGIVINASYYKSNVLQNISLKKSLIPKKIIMFMKNLWRKIQFYKRN